MQSVLEFSPPLPRSILGRKYSSPGLFLIAGDDSFQTDAPRRTPFESAEEREARFRWTDSFYEKPVCRSCGYPTAPRNERPLHLIGAPDRFDGGIGHASSDGGSMIHIVSAEFLALLSHEERQRLVLRPVTGDCGKREFFEVLGPAGPCHVALAGQPPDGWRCADCGYAVWGYWVEGLVFHSFVAFPDLPQPLPGVFTVGTPPEVHLCATKERWKELVGKKGTRGFTSEPLGVVPDSGVVRQPELSLRQK